MALEPLVFDLLLYLIRNRDHGIARFYVGRKHSIGQNPKIGLVIDGLRKAGFPE